MHIRTLCSWTLLSSNEESFFQSKDGKKEKEKPHGPFPFFDLVPFLLLGTRSSNMNWGSHSLLFMQVKMATVPEQAKISVRRTVVLD